MFVKGEIVLRPIIKEDVFYLNKWKNDEETYKYLGGGFRPVSINEHENWMDSIIKMTEYNKRFLITLSNTPVGLCGLYEINQVHRTCEIGIFIGETENRGKGIAKNAVQLLESYAKNYINLRKIKLKVVQENDQAMQFWLKNGYNQVGKLTEERYINGSYHDVLIFEKFI